MDCTVSIWIFDHSDLSIAPAFPAHSSTDLWLGTSTKLTPLDIGLAAHPESAIGRVEIDQGSFLLNPAG